MKDIFLSPYNPIETEGRIYEVWEASGFFNPDICIEKGVTSPDAKPFSIIMPPPNATGVLHMGHASMLTLEDIMIRYKRMQGFRTLWLPGTDHAAIATQSKVEKDIYKKEGKSRYDLGREELLKRIGEFVESSRSTIKSQTKVMGASCDWSREAFTLDAKRTEAVYTVFKKMYDDGLIYRGFRIVNWDPKGQTTIADDEIVYEKRKAKLYTFKYSKDFPISISTTRPETKLGDTAVAVHPEDDRYEEYIGKEYDVDFLGSKLHIKVVADESVEKEFGTGALGVTPAHSIIDWDIAERHNLPKPQIINEYAKMTVGNEKIFGKKTAEAREIVVEELRALGLIEKEEDVDQNISTAERTGGIIEPLPKLQWFVAVNKEIPGRGKTLRDITKEAIEGGKIKIIPDYFDKTYLHWINNLRDWCISRQIWYGHRIPVWYKDAEIYCGKEAPEGEGWLQDEDTLDTWFSSSLWTFSTLGWPEETPDFKMYHPTDVLETGYDILFFWVARMILMTGYVLDTIPFHTIYLHGTVRDGQGRKMSKSLGNGMDPIDIAKKYGSDAGRMALVVGNTPGTDLALREDKIKAYKLFANKIWNITRYVLSSTESYDGRDLENADIVGTDLQYIEEIDALVLDVTSDMDNYRFYLAAEKLYHYVWHTFADKIIEESKEKLKNNDPKVVLSAQYTLMHLLLTSLKLLHPFMPFVTEEIWNNIDKKPSKNLLMVERWPNKK